MDHFLHYLLWTTTNIENQSKYFLNKIDSVTLVLQDNTCTETNDGYSIGMVLFAFGS